jgi:hypothetical protein
MDGSVSHTSRGAIERAPGEHSAMTEEPQRRRTRRSTLTIVVALALVTFATLAAVVTDTAGASGSRAGATTSSPQTVTAVQTVGFDVSASVANGATTTTLLTANGAADLANGDGLTTLTIPALSGLLGSSGQVNAFWQGTNLYIEVPSALAGFLGGKTWVEVSLAGVPGISTLGSTIQSYLSSPSKLAGLVTALGGTVSDLGTQPDGSTKYQATIPVNGIVSNIKQQAHHRGVRGSKVNRSSIKPLVKDLHQLGTSTITADAWVLNGQLTKASVTVDLGHTAAALGLPGVTAGGVLTVTVALSYGVTVSLPPVPPASEVDNLGNALSFLHGLGSLGSLKGLAAHL